MSLWNLHARDPMVVRDGRPKTGDGDAGTLPFPLPGTVAGVVRTRAGSDATGRFTAHQRLETLREIALRGPLLCDDAATLYVPRPRDALFVQTDHGAALRALRPLVEDRACFDGALETAPVGLEPSRAIDGKPPKGLPIWWPWTRMVQWLESPEDDDTGEVAKVLMAKGVSGLPREHRVHVKIGAQSTAEDGMLFETVGLRLLAATAPDSVRNRLRVRPLSLACDVAIPEAAGLTLREGLGPFAGERRIVRWEQTGATLPATLPAGIKAHLEKAEATARVRLMLLTPAAFRAGWKPGAGTGELLETREGVKVTLEAAIVPRPETISGWDFEKRGPKPTRRLVAAGSVYWLRLEGTPAARVKWAEKAWMQNVSDDKQDRRDGYGLAVVGVG